eukprot:11456416-Alexandrium_andersonii.AAC.1
MKTGHLSRGDPTRSEFGPHPWRRFGALRGRLPTSAIPWTKTLPHAATLGTSSSSCPSHSD